MLTKEECLEALTEIKMYGSINIPLYSLEVIENLIGEHFSNPPLKFEELQERETYYHIYYGWISIKSIIDCECILINTLNSDGYKQIEFEEDCFYKKEVK